jgi:hypothetical protein
MATALHVRMNFRFAPLLAVLLFAAVSMGSGHAQETPPTQQPATPVPTPASVAKPLTARERKAQADMMEDAAEAVRINKLARINGVPYDQPSQGDFFRYYLRDTYGWGAQVKVLVRTLYSQARGKPEDFTFTDRLLSSEGISIINGNVRYGLGELFHEDLRYLPCHHCKAKAKIRNALLSEVTARHEEDGHRFFTLTPTIADFSGPIIAHSTWYPTFDPLAGVISARTVFATRIGGHLFQEFVMERIHPGLKPQN